MAKNNKALSKVKMVDNKLLLLIEKKETIRKDSGIIMVKQSAEAHTEFGSVVCAGPGTILESGNRLPMNCKVGDRVVLPRSAGVGVFMNSIQYRFVRDNDIIAIVPEDYNHDEVMPENDEQAMIREALKNKAGGR